MLDSLTTATTEGIMGSIDSAMVHTCQVLTTSQDNKLSFTSGSVVFTAGATLTGATSDASGVIKTIVLSSGSWAEGNAAGYLILYSVSGAFTSGETISDDTLAVDEEGHTTKPAGTATTSGTLIPQTNAAGTPTTTTQTLPSDSTYYDCLFSNFSNNSTSGNYISDSDAGQVIFSSPMVFLPSKATVQEGDHVTTTQTNWSGTYKVQKVDAPEIPFSSIPDHKEAFLKVVKKRG